MISASGPDEAATISLISYIARTWPGKPIPQGATESPIIPVSAG